ncbi:MAG: hypothetical protein KJ734_11320 [Chloroflexi bacterium]|nr:hypothetical protein [Chloroflexota bacterium]
MRIKRTFAIGPLIAIVLGLLLGCICPGPTPTPPQPQPPGGGQPPAPQPAARPDLIISAIEVFPAQPTAGQRFALNVYVRNQGQAASGQYDLAISIRDVGRSSTYPAGTFRQSGLQPGENVVAYTSTDRLVNDPGSYQVQVEIKPFLFTDGETGNNSAAWAFIVK